MTIDPPPYGAHDIVRLRPPEVEEVDGGWRSRWALRLASAPTTAAVHAVENELQSADPSLHARVTPLAGSLVRLEFTTALPPMEVDSYTTVDMVLLAMDQGLGPLTEINDSPRDHWRTFRNRSA